eukprot:486454_1
MQSAESVQTMANMILKIKARLSNAKSHPLPDSKCADSDDEDVVKDVPSLRNSVAALSATLSNPKRLIGQEEMVHSILLGIQATNRKLSSNKTDNTIDPTTIASKLLQKHCQETIKLECPSCGSDLTKPHSFDNFSFESFAPLVFASLRVHFKIQNELHSSDYLHKLCGVSPPNNDDNEQKQETLNLTDHTSFWKTLITNSKSGQLFYKTKDLLLIIKSMSKSECTFLRNHLHQYYQHMTHEKDSLISQFFGLYKVDIEYQKPVYILIQKSVLYSHPQKLKMNKLYDLKGSTFGREATRWKIELPIDDMEQINNSIRSGNVDDIADAIDDIDYTKPAELGDETHFDEQFSCSFYVPDLHETDSMKEYKSPTKDEPEEEEEKKGHRRKESGSFFKRSKILKDLDFIKDHQCIYIGLKRRTKWLAQLKRDTAFLTQLNVMDYSLLLGMHYKLNDKYADTSLSRWNEGELYRFDHGGMSYCDQDEIGMMRMISEDADDDNDEDLEQSWSDENDMKEQLQNCIYFGGIIDILQPYNARKKMETFVMGIKTDKTKVSCVEPEQYSKRLVGFMKNAVH